MGDSLTQYVARVDAIDPKERIWGDTPYHIDLTPGEGRGGFHFDFVGHNIVAVLGWSLWMPTAYARAKYNHGSTGAVTYMDRVKDKLLKTYNPVNLGWRTLTWEWPGWASAKAWTLSSYRRNAGEDLDPEAFARFEEEVGGRLTSVKSYVERSLYHTVIGSLYVNPQYNMHGELDSILPKITGGTKTSKLISSLVMPFTTGYFGHKWWADYFGTDNPAMIEILRQFQADGLLDKIDEDGFTDMRTWTLHEISTLSSLVTLFEAHKLEQETPFPEDNPAEAARWYGELYARLLRGHPEPAEMDFESPEDISRILSRVRVAGARGETTSFMYEREARELLSRFRQIEARTRQYSLGPESRRTVFLRPAEQSTEDIFRENIEKTLDDAVVVQGILSQTLGSMRENRETFVRLNRTVGGLAMVDTLILADFLFSGSLSGFLHSDGTAASASRGTGSGLAALRRRFGRWTQKLVRGWALPAAIATVPLYFWLGKHAGAHGNIQGVHAELLEELQDILFQLTYTLTTVQVAQAYDGEALTPEIRSTLEEYRAELEEKEELLGEVLRQTQQRNEVLQGRRIYRIPRVLTGYAPVGMGMGASWMGVRWLLYKSSGGFVTRMTDQFAPGLFKLSALFWVGFSPIADGIDQEVALTSQDFFSLNRAYYQTLLEKNMIRHVLEEGVDSIDWQRDVVDRALEDETMAQAVIYQNRLIELLESVEAD